MRRFTRRMRHTFSDYWFGLIGAAGDDGNHHGAIVRGFVVVAIFGVLAKIAAGAKEFALAWRFGTSEDIDAYLFVFNLYGVPIAIWVGALGGIFIPHLVRLKRSDPEQAAQLRAEMNAAATVTGLVIGLVTAVLTILLVNSGLTGLSPTVAAKAITLAMALWPMIPALFLIQVGSSQLMSARLHVNTAYEGLPALALIIAVWLVNGAWTALVVGTLVGIAMQLIATLASIKRMGEPAAFQLGFKSSAWKKLSPGFWLLVLAYSLQGASALIDQFLLANLGPGAISTYGYASRLLALIITLGGIAIGRTILPILSSIGLENRDAFVRTTRTWVLVMFAAGVVFFGAFGLLSTQIVKLVFEHGAFSNNDTQNVAHLAWFLALAVPFFFAMTVLVQAQLASDGHRNIVVFSALTLLGKIAFGIPLVWKYGVTGLAIANIMVTGFQFAYLASVSGFLNFPKRHSEGER